MCCPQPNRTGAVVVFSAGSWTNLAHQVTYLIIYASLLERELSTKKMTTHLMIEGRRTLLCDAEEAREVMVWVKEYIVQEGI